MGFKEIPYLVQAYLVNKVCDLPDFLTPEGRKEVVEHRAACLTNPYLKGKYGIWLPNMPTAASGCKQSWTESHLRYYSRLWTSIKENMCRWNG